MNSNVWIRFGVANLPIRTDWSKWFRQSRGKVMIRIRPEIMMSGQCKGEGGAETTRLPRFLHQEIAVLREKDGCDSFPGKLNACPARYAQRAYTWH